MQPDVLFQSISSDISCDSPHLTQSSVRFTGEESSLKSAQDDDSMFQHADKMFSTVEFMKHDSHFVLSRQSSAQSDFSVQTTSSFATESVKPSIHVKSKGFQQDKRSPALEPNSVHQEAIYPSKLSKKMISSSRQSSVTSLPETNKSDGHSISSNSIAHSHKKKRASFDFVKSSDFLKNLKKTSVDLKRSFISSNDITEKELNEHVLFGSLNSSFCHFKSNLPESVLSKLILYLNQENQIETLYLSNSILSSSHAVNLSKIFSNPFTKLKELNLSTCRVTDSLLRPLVQHLYFNTSLVSLSLSHNEITDKGCESLSLMLFKNSTLTKLWLGYNRLTDEAALFFSNCLKENSTLKELFLTSNLIGNQGAIDLSQMLKVNRTLSKLDLSHNPIKEVGMISLSQALAENPVMKELSITKLQKKEKSSVSCEKVETPTTPPEQSSKTKLTGKSVVPDAENQAHSVYTHQKPWANGSSRQSSTVSLDGRSSFTSNKSLPPDEDNLQTLFLGNLLSLIDYGDMNSNYCRLHNLSSEELKGLSYTLEKNQTLHTLVLQNSLVDSKSVYYLATGLILNTCLTEVTLSKMGIEDQAVRYLAKCLLYNSVLRKLKLPENRISFKGASSLANYLMTNTTLQELWLSSNQIGDNGLIALSQMLKRNTALKILLLGYNRITDVGVEELSQCLVANVTLEKLSLGGNSISDHGLRLLKEAQKKSQTLIDLDVCSHIEKLSKKKSFFSKIKKIFK